MSLSDEVRAELASIDPKRVCCRLAELAGLVLAAGSVVHDNADGELHVRIDLSAAAVARRGYTLLRSFDVSAEVQSYRRSAFGREPRYVLDVHGSPRAVQVMEEAGVVDRRLVPRDVPPARVIRRSCCRAALLRGAVLGGGSITGPRGIHVELRAQTSRAAEFLTSVARGAGVDLRVVERPRHSAAYTKSVETAADLLALMGAHGAALALRESTVVSATRAHANRLANADHANLVRASRSAHTQIRAIRRLEAAGTLEGLSPELVEIAQLRLEHASFTLRELAERCDPPTTKATAHRRLRRLERLADT